MLLRIGLIAATLGLIAAGWTYASAIATVVPARMHAVQLACAAENCIAAIPCRTDAVAGWNDSLYAAAKAPGVELRPCRATTELAQGD